MAQLPQQHSHRTPVQQMNEVQNPSPSPLKDTLPPQHVPEQSTLPPSEHQAVDTAADGKMPGSLLSAKRRRQEEHERFMEAAQAEKRRRREENVAKQEELKLAKLQRQQKKKDLVAKQLEEQLAAREAKEQRRREGRERQLARRERELREVVLRVDAPALLAALKDSWAAAGTDLEAVTSEALFGSVTLRYKTEAAAQKAVEAGSLPFTTPEALRFAVSRQPVKMHCWYFDGELPPELGADLETLRGHLQPVLENHFGPVRAVSRVKGHVLVEFESLEGAAKLKEDMAPLGVGLHLLPKLCPGLPKQQRKGVGGGGGAPDRQAADPGAPDGSGAAAVAAAAPAGAAERSSDRGASRGGFPFVAASLQPSTSAPAEAASVGDGAPGGARAGKGPGAGEAAGACEGTPGGAVPACAAEQAPSACARLPG